MRHVVVLMVFFASANAAAQEVEQGAEPPVTRPHDYGFGENQLHERFHFPDETEHSAPVDRRGELDAASHRTILMPSARTPEQHTVQYSNFMVALHQLSYSPTDAVQLTATAKWGTPLSEPQVGLAGKFRLSTSQDTTFSLQPFSTFRNESEPEEAGTRDFGSGVAGLVDVAVTNHLVVTLGLTAYATLWYGYEEWNYDACESRSDYLDGACRDTSSGGMGLPPGGHFVMGHVGATYYVLDQWALKGELLSAVAAGSLLGTEFLVAAPQSISADRARFEEGDLGIGAPYDSKLTLGLGFQWSNGLFAVQFSGYGYLGDAVGTERVSGLEWIFTPMVNAAVAF